MTGAPAYAHPQSHVAETEATVRERFGDEVADYFHRRRLQLSGRARLQGALAADVSEPSEEFRRGHEAALKMLERQAREAEAAGSTVSGRAVLAAIETVRWSERRP